MPGKRPRQIQRTTSMSQLGSASAAMGARFSQTAPEGFYGDAGAFHRGLSSPLKQELHEIMEVCTGAAEKATPGAFMEESPHNMVIDGSAEESLYASHAVRPGAFHPAHQATHPCVPHIVHLGALPPAHQATHLSGAPHLLHLGALPPAHQATHPSSSPHALQNKSVGSQSSLHRAHDTAGSADTAHFLDVCFLCSKRLGHGRDVFIYRGDRAFCSVECRHFQIVADERREKCGLTAIKEGVGVNTTASDPPSTGQVETAAAA